MQEIPRVAEVLAHITPAPKNLQATQSIDHPHHHDEHDHEHTHFRSHKEIEQDIQRVIEQQYPIFEYHTASVHYLGDKQMVDVIVTLEEESDIHKLASQVASLNKDLVKHVKDIHEANVYINFPKQ
jgi:hypothetical protein